MELLTNAAPSTTATDVLAPRPILLRPTFVRLERQSAPTSTETQREDAPGTTH